VPTPGKKPRLQIVREVLTDPHWWLRDVLTALILGALVAAGSIAGQKMVDDSRAAREDADNAAQNRHREQLEDLRFVRDGSSSDPDRPRPFSNLDLEGQNLVGLALVGADFAYADLDDALLIRSDVSRGDFTRADLRNANISLTNLRGAYFGVDRLINDANQHGADLTGADLTEADLTGADLGHDNLTNAKLDKANVTDVFYDAPYGPTVFARHRAGPLADKHASLEQRIQICGA
jgi:uncharacterized protein YjbI with pentapeptide repeats